MYNLKNGGIYCIYSLVNNKKYIGQTVAFGKRWATHQSDLRNNKHHSCYLQNHYNVHGKEVLVYSIIEVIKRENLSLKDYKNLLTEREQYYMNNYNCEFNLCPAAGSPLGIKKTAQQLKDQRISNIGKGISSNNNKFCVCFNLFYKTYCLGTYNNYEEALTIRLEAESKFWFNENFNILSEEEQKIIFNRYKTKLYNLNKVHLYFEEIRNFYYVKVNLFGKRIYISSYKTEKEALDIKLELNSLILSDEFIDLSKEQQMKYLENYKESKKPIRLLPKYIMNRKNKYQFEYNPTKHNKSFSSLEQAISYKDIYLTTLSKEH